MTNTRYFDERSAALEAVGLDPDGDEWATPDNWVDPLQAYREEWYDQWAEGEDFDDELFELDGFEVIELDAYEEEV